MAEQRVSPVLLAAPQLAVLNAMGIQVTQANVIESIELLTLLDIRALQIATIIALSGGIVDPMTTDVNAPIGVFAPATTFG